MQGPSSPSSSSSLRSHILPVNVHVRQDGLEQRFLVHILHADDDDGLDGIRNAFPLHVDGCSFAQVEDAGNGPDLGVRGCRIGIRICIHASSSTRRAVTVVGGRARWCAHFFVLSTRITN